jgi:probable rRNA maturation factor
VLHSHSPNRLILKALPLTSNPGTEVVFLNESGIGVPVSEADIRFIADAIADGENVSFHLVEVAYVDENAIKALNNTYLGKDYITDIITFPYSSADQTNDIEVTLTCCAQRIDEQTAEFGTERKAEFCRVIIHGLLHVSGYDDRTDSDSLAIRNRENYYLDLLNLAT